MDNLNNIKATKPRVLKHRTTDGSIAHLRLQIWEIPNFSPVLIIHKRVLLKNYVGMYEEDFKVIRMFKDHYLVEQVFSIKIETLIEVMDYVKQLEFGKVMEISLN